MTVRYQNVSRSTDEANFLEVTTLAAQQHAVFRSKRGTFRPVPGAAISMTSGTVRTTALKDAVVPGLATPVPVEQSVDIKFNVLYGQTADLIALRNEAVRLMDAAIADYSLVVGIVPPSEATFASV